MYKLLFETTAEKTLESVNAAFLRETGDPEWKFESMEEIERAEKYGFLEFEDGKMRAFIECIC